MTWESIFLLLMCGCHSNFLFLENSSFEYIRASIRQCFNINIFILRSRTHYVHSFQKQKSHVIQDHSNVNMNAHERSIGRCDSCEWHLFPLTVFHLVIRLNNLLQWIFNADNSNTRWKFRSADIHCFQIDLKWDTVECRQFFEESSISFNFDL